MITIFCVINTVMTIKFKHLSHWLIYTPPIYVINEKYTKQIIM